MTKSTDWHAKHDEKFGWLSRSLQDQAKFQITHAMSCIQDRGVPHTRTIFSGRGVRRLLVTVNNIPYDIDKLRREGAVLEDWIAGLQFPYWQPKIESFLA